MAVVVGDGGGDSRGKQNRLWSKQNKNDDGSFALHLPPSPSLRRRSLSKPCVAAPARQSAAPVRCGTSTTRAQGVVAGGGVAGPSHCACAQAQSLHCAYCARAQSSHCACCARARRLPRRHCHLRPAPPSPPPRRRAPAGATPPSPSTRRAGCGRPAGAGTGRACRGPVVWMEGHQRGWVKAVVCALCLQPQPYALPPPLVFVRTSMVRRPPGGGIRVGSTSARST
jgi:hypothetical protein